MAHFESAMYVIGGVFGLICACAMLQMCTGGNSSRRYREMEFPSPDELEAGALERRETKLASSVERLKRMLASKETQLKGAKTAREAYTARTARVAGGDGDGGDGGGDDERAKLMFDQRGREVYGEEAWDEGVDGGLPLKEVFAMKEEEVRDLQNEARKMMKIIQGRTPRGSDERGGTGSMAPVSNLPLAPLSQSVPIGPVPSLDLSLVGPATGGEATSTSGIKLSLPGFGSKSRSITTAKGGYSSDLGSRRRLPNSGGGSGDGGSRGSDIAGRSSRGRKTRKRGSSKRREPSPDSDSSDGVPFAASSMHSSSAGSGGAAPSGMELAMKRAAEYRARQAAQTAAAAAAASSGVARPQTSMYGAGGSAQSGSTGARGAASSGGYTIAVPAIPSLPIAPGAGGGASASVPPPSAPAATSVRFSLPSSAPTAAATSSSTSASTEASSGRRKPKRDSIHFYQE